MYEYLEKLQGKTFVRFFLVVVEQSKTVSNSLVKRVKKQMKHVICQPLQRRPESEPGMPVGAA